MDRRRFVRGALAAGALAPFALSPAVGAPGAPPADEPPRRDDERDVRAFGARGDGAHDDTDAVQRAIDAGPGTVRFSPGSFRITRPITVALAERGPISVAGSGGSRVIMAGAGPAFHLAGTHTGTADPESVADAVWDRERLPLLTGLEIRGAHAEADGVRLEGTMQATLTALLVRRCRTGIHLTRRNRNLLIASCHVYHNLETGVLFDAVNLHQAIIASSHVSYNPLAGIWLRGGEMRNFQIVGNDIEYNHDEGRQGSADVLIDMRPEGSSFREGSIAGNTIQARPSPGGANVRVLGGSGVHSGGLLALTGNLIGSQTDAIHVADCRGVSITGNSLYSAADRTIHIERCAAVTISANTIDWNPDHRGKRLADGVVIADSDGVVVNGLILENCFRGSEEAGGAIEVLRSRHVDVSGCQVLDPRHRGIVVADSTRCRVSGCTVVDRRAAPTMRIAIEVRGAGRENLVTGNIVSRGVTAGLVVAPGTAIARDNVEIEGT